MPAKNKVDIFTRYRKAVQNELICWARLSLEKKFVIAFFLLTASLISASFTPLLSSVLNVWGGIIFFEALFQKKLKWEKWNGRNILITYLAAGIIGTVTASFLLLYFDILYYLKLSIFDFLTRYIWFLLPLSKLTEKIKKPKSL